MGDAPSVGDSARLLSLLDGVEPAVCAVLGIRRWKHSSALTELGCREALPSGVVETMFRTIERNWLRAQAAGEGTKSKQNWRWCAPQPQISETNRSPEVMLERALAIGCVRAGRQDLANQVPVASGIVSSVSERRRAIDLVHRVAPNRFEFIELKIGSDTPLYAAIEIIEYAAIWLLTRRDTRQLESAVLRADHIDARVLAPQNYYAPFRLQALESLLDREVAALGASHDATMTFRFDVLDDGLTATLPDPGTVLALMDHRRPLS